MNKTDVVPAIPDWRPTRPLGEAVIQTITGQRRVPLGKIVDLLAFEDGRPSTEVSLSERALRQGVARYLFNAGARDGEVLFFGFSERGSDKFEQIPPEHFEIPRWLGYEEDSIDTDLDSVPMDKFIAARQGKHRLWFGVKVDIESLTAWHRAQTGGTPPKGRRRAAVSERQIEQLLRNHWANRCQGQPAPTQASDLEYVRSHIPDVPRSAFRNVRSRIVQPEMNKRGPKGPRKPQR